MMSVSTVINTSINVLDVGERHVEILIVQGISISSAMNLMLKDSACIVQTAETTYVIIALLPRRVFGEGNTTAGNATLG